jgi:hypothetical protein
VARRPDPYGGFGLQMVRTSGPLDIGRATVRATSNTVAKQWSMKSSVVCGPRKDGIAAHAVGQGQAVADGGLVAAQPVDEAVQVGLVIGFDGDDPGVEAFAVAADEHLGEPGAWCRASCRCPRGGTHRDLPIIEPMFEAA